MGGKKTKEQQAWYGMHSRCRIHPHYAGRVFIDMRWHGRSGLSNFLKDMGPCPSKAHSLDRINGQAGYEPSNCRWATRIEQASNRTNNVLLPCFGESKTMAEWARDPRCTVNEHTLAARIRRKWSPFDAVTAPEAANKGTPRGCPHSKGTRRKIRQMALLQHRRQHTRRLPIGVYKGRHAYLARITINQSVTHLGSFRTVRAAHAARKAAEKRLNHAV